MTENDVTTVGLSETADDLLSQLHENEVFADKLDGYRFAVAFAIASGIVPQELTKRKTLFNVGSLDPGQLIRSSIEMVYQDEAQLTSPYRLAERLADWGVRELFELYSHGKLDFVKLLSEVEARAKNE